MNNDPRGTMFQQGDIMRINNAYVEDVSCSNNSSGSILVSYAVHTANQIKSQPSDNGDQCGRAKLLHLLHPQGDVGQRGLLPRYDPKHPASVQRLLGCDPEDAPGPGSAGAAGSPDSASAARTALASGSAAAAQTSGAANSAQAPSPQTSGASHAAPEALLHDHRQNRPD